MRSVLKLVCPDGPGILADVSGFLHTMGANIVDAGQFSDVDHDLFVQRVEFTHDATHRAIADGFTAVASRWDMRWDLVEHKPQARMAVLVSKDGHCLYDLLGRCATGALPAQISAVISNHPDLAAAAASFGVPFRTHLVADHRASQEQQVVEDLRRAQPDLIVLARYMQVLSPGFCDEFGTHTINIHHSFLPAFVGANPYRQAWERGVKLIGATAHYVTAELDAGPIIAQDVTRVSHSDDARTMALRGQDLEATVLATAVRLHLEHRVFAYEGRTVVFD